MSRSNHTEAQMIGALEATGGGAQSGGRSAGSGGVEVHDLRLEAKYGGMDVSEAQEAKQLRDENARLKKLVVDLSLDKEMLKAVIAKTDGARRPAGGRGLAASDVRGQRAPGLRADGDGGGELSPLPLCSERMNRCRTRLVELARSKPRFGYRRLQVLLQRGGRAGEPQAGASGVSRGRVDDPAQEAEALRARGKASLLARTAANQEWALDFIHDAVAFAGRTIRVLSVVDAYTRECLALEVDTKLRQPESKPSVGPDHHRAGQARSDPL